jgi:hypothetical protein
MRIHYFHLDKSPLENHHVASFFLIIQDQQYNILQNFKPEDYKAFRLQIISMVLSTDMAVHYAGNSQTYITHIKRLGEA